MTQPIEPYEEIPLHEVPSEPPPDDTPTEPHHVIPMPLPFDPEEPPSTK